MQTTLLRAELRARLKNQINDAFLGTAARRNFSIFEVIFREDLYGAIDWDIYLPKAKTNLQRGFVWSDAQKNDFLIKYFTESQLLQYCPPVIMNNLSGKNAHALLIIDGKQRISTLFEFYTNKRAIIIDNEFIFYADYNVATNQTATINVLINQIDTDLTAPEWIAENEDALIQQFEHVNFASVPQEYAHMQKLRG